MDILLLGWDLVTILLLLLALLLLLVMGLNAVGFIREVREDDAIVSQAMNCLDGSRWLLARSARSSNNCSALSISLQSPLFVLSLSEWRVIA